VLFGMRRQHVLLSIRKSLREEWRLLHDQPLGLRRRFLLQGEGHRVYRRRSPLLFGSLPRHRCMPVYRHVVPWLQTEFRLLRRGQWHLLRGCGHRCSVYGKLVILQVLRSHLGARSSLQSTTRMWRTVPK